MVRPSSPSTEARSTALSRIASPVLVPFSVTGVTDRHYIKARTFVKDLARWASADRRGEAYEQRRATEDRRDGGGLSRRLQASAGRGRCRSFRAAGDRHAGELRQLPRARPRRVRPGGGNDVT